MKRKLIYATSLLLILTGLAACIDPFSPPEINSPDRYLVFDGFLNTNGQDTSWIRLSRTQNLKENNRPEPERGAAVEVESEGGQRYRFTESSPGTYFLPPTETGTEEKVRVLLALRNGETYHSDYVPVVISPEIDNLYYTLNGKEGLQVYVDTHDPSNSTRFYRWGFEETWQYRAPLFSGLEVVVANGDTNIVPRKVDINQCWKSFRSSQINIFTTVKLSADIVKLHPITYIDAATGKLLSKYSIQVTQNALTREAYDYWNELSKTTEATGSIFDPFPSRVTGNIRSASNPDVPAFGYFSAGKASKKRIFIKESLGIFNRCDPSDTLARPDAIVTSALLLHEYYQMGSSVPEYVVAYPSCADCRLGGGTIQKPPFWE